MIYINLQFFLLTFQWGYTSIFLANVIPWAIFVVCAFFLYTTDFLVKWISKIAIRTSTEWSMLAWSTNSISTANYGSFADVHTLSLTKSKSIDLTSFCVSTIFVASAFFRGGTNSSSAFVKAWTVVVFVTFWNAFVIDANLARQTISYGFTGC